MILIQEHIIRVYVTKTDTPKKTLKTAQNVK